MSLSERLIAEARQARLIAGNVLNEQYRTMLVGLAERLEREAQLLAPAATEGQGARRPADGSGRVSRPGGHP